MQRNFLWKIAPLAVFLAASNTAQGAQPVLNRLDPQGAQRGTKIKIAAIGNRLGDGPHEVLFYQTGIEALGVDATDKNRVMLTLQIADDCRLGQHPLRLRTASGLSNLLTFHVGALHETREKEPNHKIDTAQPIAIDTVVNGCVRNEDVDVFVVDVTAGERLSVEIEGLRLGRTFFDPVIEILDAQGKLLARSDDQSPTYQDAFISLKVPKTERLFIRVRDVTYGGNNSATYRLHVGRFPRPLAMFPPVVVAGQSSTVTWIGDPLGAAEQNVEGASLSDETFDVYPADDFGVSPTSLPALVVARRPLLETEPNNTVKSAQEFAAPGVACGTLQTSGDRDYFRFAAKKGKRLLVRVWGRRLRSRIDPILRVLDSKGKQLAVNDDNTRHPDSLIRFQPPADGEYIAEVTDRLNRGSSDRVYTLQVKPMPAIADLRFQEHRRYEARVLEVPQGGRTATVMTVARRGFSGPLATQLSGLPEGVTYVAPELAGNFNRVPLLLEAGNEAPLAASLAKVEVEKIDNQRAIHSQFVQHTWLVRGRNNNSVWSHFARRAPVAVTTRRPFSIRLEPPKAPLVLSGEKQLKVIAERDKGFDEAIRVRMLYNPPGVSSNASRSIPKKKLEATIPLSAGPKAREGNWSIVVIGEAPVDGQAIVATQMVTLKVAKPHFEATIPTLTTRRGAVESFELSLKQTTHFDGKAELELVRLPPGVTAEKIHVTAESQSATFQLTIDKKAPVGRHRGVGCRARMTIHDEPVVFTQGYADLHIDPASNASPKQAKQQNTGGKRS